MANNISTLNKNAGVFAKAVALAMENECPFTKSLDKVPKSEFDGKNAIKSGNKVNFTIPARKPPIDGFDITGADKEVNDEVVSMELDIKKSTPFSMTSEELATDVSTKQAIERYAKRYASDMAQVIEQEHIKRATIATANIVGTPGATTYDSADILKARMYLNRYLAPKDKDRNLIFDSEAGANAVNARENRFNSSARISEQYETGLIGKADGFKWYETELIHRHVNGSDVTGVAVNGASQTGTSLSVDGLEVSAGTVTAGTVFTIAGVYAVNPITKEPYNHLQPFVVKEDVTADGSGEAVLSISPEIITTGTKKNVTVAPADNAVLSFSGLASTGYLQTLAYHKEAFRICSMPLEMPKNAEFAGQYTTKAGLTVQVIRDYDFDTREFSTRIDYYGGFVAIRPEWSCRITA